MDYLEKNIQTIAGALRTAGALSMTLEYYGSGDSGDCTGVNVTWPDQPGHLPDNLTIYLETYSRTATGQYEKQFIETHCDCDSAIREAWEQAISQANHDGWENEEGGGGTFTIYADGHAELEHYDNIVETIHDSHSFGKVSQDGAQAEGV